MNSQLSDTIKILRMIGSPYIKKEYENLFNNKKKDVLKLYNFAKTNKIGFTFLEYIKDGGKLEEFELNSIYDKEKQRSNGQQKTMDRISKLFNLSNIDYAIFKSKMPFPAITNDIDIIHFGSDKNYKNLIELLIGSDYIEVKGEMDAEQSCFHDAICGDKLIPHPKTKDVYDVDIYQKIAASHLIYIDKRKIKNEIDINNNIRLLKPEAELAVIIIHSIIPEMICTLSLYYAVLNHTSRMDSEELNRFIYLTKFNNITYAVKIVFSITAELHKIAHGFVPQKIDKILMYLGKDTKEKNILINNNFKMPHRYSNFVVAKILTEKVKENAFRKSIFDQMIYMCNPKFLKWFITELLWRRKRDTY